jgi:hypothetical protein
LENGRYLILLDVSGYSVEGSWVDIPETAIQPYDFNESISEE